MGKDRTFLGFTNKSAWAGKFWPVGHRRFEEMCALAITGQLGGAQMCELDEHIAACESCRKYLESVAQVSVQVMPLLAEKHGPDRKLSPPTGMRERFLQRLSGEALGGESGGKLRPFPVPAKGMYAPPQADKDGKTGTDQKDGTSLFSSVLRPIAIAAACLLVIGVAYYAGSRRTAQRAQVTQTAPNARPTAPLATKSVEPDRVSELERQKNELESKLATMTQELTVAQNERESLHRELAAARRKLAAITTQAANLPTQDSSLTAQQSNEQVSSLQADVSRLSQRLAESEIKFGIEKQANADLTSKLELTSADLDRERDLKSAKSEMGDLAASRNLHIVDVYDADPNGRRQRSFGRVFYIEGQSLVFYAYDLDDPGRFKTNVAFHVWGGKAGVKEVTHSLGILHKDDSGQNRWAMTFDDPKVLTQINSVFVTAESASKSYDQPHGKKVLYAYFGSPANHP
jgi:hypothetical protein